MKKTTLFLTLLFAFSAHASPLHLDLEMSTEEYRQMLKKIDRNKSMPEEIELNSDNAAISEAIKLGDRLSKWIARVNEARSPESAIRLTSPLTRRGIPIDKPNMYSPSIIKKETQSILSEIPAEIKNVLLSRDQLPATIPMDDETFIIHARRVDKNYQSAARYKGVDQYRVWYIEAANQDVRGLHYLQTNKITDADLVDVAAIPSSKLSEIKNALILVCMNDIQSNSRCTKKTDEAFANNKVADLYLAHIEAAKKVWEGFFKIPVDARRKDVRWGSHTHVPFNTPEIAKFGPYLKDNIEDEFRWDGWGLKINFGSYSNGPYLKFEPGVVPHVNKLGGNEIVMDSNQPIEEYESQWTIRHEFGHVLGLPDCYHEFYDTTARAYVNYQLDITDLMCSRAGNMNERLYQELKEAYDR